MKISINKHASDIAHVDIETWLDENLGQYKARWNMVAVYEKVDYYFRNDTDAAYFALRWL